jgi:cation transport protein ChaC
MNLTPELVALCDRAVEDPGDENDPYDSFRDDDYTIIVSRLLRERPKGQFWLFAYGSLIWKPEFEVRERRRAIARGWQRGFSMRIERFRGTPEQHGYMMCLDRGGICEGVVLALSEADLEAQLHKLVFREIGCPQHLEAMRWIDVETTEGVVPALVFFAAPALLHTYQPNRPLAEVAHALARACGHWGSGAEYLRNTVAHLEDMGIHDQRLWLLQEMVAAELRAMQRITG